MGDVSTGTRISTRDPGPFRSGAGAGLNATGTTQAGAAPLLYELTQMLTVPAGAGVILPRANVAARQSVRKTVWNFGASTLKVYPPENGQIDALGIDVADTIAAGKSKTYWALEPGQYRTEANLFGAVQLGADAANYVQVTGASSGSAPSIGTAGADATIGLTLAAKNGGPITFASRTMQSYTQAAAGTVAKFITSDNTLTGTGGGAFSGNTININDSLDNGGADFYDHYVATVLSGAYTGGRANLRSLLQINTAATSANKFYTATNSTASAGVNLNGGVLLAHSAEARLTSGGSAGLLEAIEFGAGLETGASAPYVNVLKISPLRNGVAPSVSFNGLAFSSDGVGQQLFVGIAFGGQEAAGWPIATNGKLIAITDPAGSPAKTVAYGIDFRSVACTFTTAAFASPGFLVDGSGRITGTVWGNYANDAAAAGGGVPIGGIYCNGSILMIRVT